MLALASAAQAGLAKAVFLLGRIEDIPLPDGHVDVVISNCLVNLSADKPRVLAEAYRVLKPGGRLGISDVTADEGTDPGRLAAAERQAGSGAALTQPQYRGLLQAAGFTGISITSTTGAGDGLHSAIIQAAKPGPGRQHAVKAGPCRGTAAPPPRPATCRPARPPDGAAPPCRRLPSRPAVTAPAGPREQRR